MIASIILILHLMGFIGLETAIPLLYVGGALLILAEVFIGSMGIIAFNGLLSLFIGYVLQTGGATLFGYPLDWGLIFGIAFFEFVLLVAMVMMIKKINDQAPTVGAESMVGEQAKVVSWDGTKGKVFIQGELWNAVSDKAMDLEKDDEITVEAVNKLTLTVKA